MGHQLALRATHCNERAMGAPASRAALRQGPTQRHPLGLLLCVGVDDVSLDQPEWVVGQLGAAEAFQS